MGMKEPVCEGQGEETRRAEQDQRASSQLAGGTSQSSVCLGPTGGQPN